MRGALLKPGARQSNSLHIQSLLYPKRLVYENVWHVNMIKLHQENKYF